jgi:hypothetical protein
MYGSREAGQSWRTLRTLLYECARFVRQHDPREMFALFALCRLKAGNLGTQTMTETTALTRALVDLCTMTGRLDLGIWADFKTAHVIEAQQIEPVLVDVIGHLCTLSRELTEEVGRLSHALAWRGR